tara:strand:+ start:10271 stop:15844 length:5574 start_codon:yes stop_codon:yes gene_type:complete
MAEFKLSRIRFNWKSYWSSGTDYVVDDMIEYNGFTYVALRTHASADFYNDLGGTDVTPARPKWKKQSEGKSWKNLWTVSTFYAIGNLVKYGASVYECTESHTSSATFSSATDGLIADINKWTLVAVSSADWKYNWTINTLYRINDLVRYNGKVYKCTAQHVSAATILLGLEADQAKWTVLSDSDTWRGTWSIGTRYKVNDIAKYGGIVYKCINGHTSADNITLGLEEDQAKWEIQSEGIEYVTKTDENTGVISGAWQEAYRYKKNDIVKRGGNLVKALSGHTSTSGNAGFKTDTAAGKWGTYLPGTEYEGVWADNVYYQPGDLVLYGGYIYKAITYSVGLKPGQNPTDWNVTFEGYKFRNDWNNAGSADSSTIVDYRTGDFVRLQGSLYIAIQDSTNLQPDSWPTYWEKVIEGRNHRDFWEDNTEYYAGDIVSWQGSAYVCVKYHRSTESDSRPDLDVEQPQQDYWKLMILGTRTNKLARKGDLKTFEDQDSTAIDTQRLAIGTTGQVLRATNSMPSWDTIDLQRKLYYVAENGVDNEAQGGTLNAPFRTVRFAMAYLLRDENNRVGIGAKVQVSAGDYAEILPISLPANVVLQGAELRTTTIRPAVAGTHTVKGETTVADPNPDDLTIPTNNVNNDMFYVRNGCGIRDCTLKGLTGTLGAANTYGTKRPSGGAFVSLDPGTGTSDSSVWIASTNKMQYTPTGGSYNPATGVMSLTIPVAGYTPTTGTTYDPATGIMKLEFGTTHGLTVGEEITFDNNSLTFTCAKDNYDTNHTYPRVTDPAYGEKRKIIATTGTSITVNVGINPDGVYDHRFVSSSNDSVNWAHNIKVGQAVTIDAGSLVWTCAMDSHQTDHPYPRTTDPYYNKKILITAVGATSITMNVGISSNTSAHLFKSASAGAVNMERIQAGKSPYIQGVSTIGDNCVGMKIDGALHDGGNRSIVANDFTQVLSDGIGYWATNLGRSELVSVFTYYAHIGYLAESGGILRATNGNNSYGDFGSVAEGYDTAETPQTVTVNNRTGEAAVEDILVGNTNVLALAYNNNGQTYSTATPTVSQANGTGLDMRWQEIRNGAIDKITLDLPPLGDSTNIGGRGYKFATNNAQGGDTDQITLAASEARTAAQMNGMRIIIKGGVGSGQFGYIWNYDPSTKTAMVYRESDQQPGWDNIVPGKVSALTLDATTEYEFEPRVTFSDPPHAQTNNSVAAGSLDIGYSDGTGQFYYSVPGTSKWYVSADGSLWTERENVATIGSRQWNRFSKGGSLIVGVANNDAIMGFSNDGIAWDSSNIGAGQPWSAVQLGGSDGNTIIATATGTATVYRAVLTTDGSSTVVPATWNTSTASSTDIKGIAYGAGKWIAMGETGTTSTSTDGGATWSSGSAVTLDGTEKYSDIVFGNNCWVASLDNADRIIYSADGSNWYDSGLVGDSGREDWKVAYTQGVFIAVSSTGTTLTSDNGYVWKIKATNSNLTHIVGGKKNNLPAFVGLNSTANGNIITTGARAIGRVEIANGKIDKFKLYDPGSGYSVAPTVTIYDPEAYGEPYYTVSIKNGVLPQPIFYNRGVGYQSAIITLTGDGFAEELQIGNTMKISGVTAIPGPGSNFRITGQDTTIYRVVKVTANSGTSPNIELTFQISPVLTRGTAPIHGTTATIRERYSQCRLTGHDFLDIGTGNFTNTNYPGLYVFGQDLANETEQANEVVESNGGRVFYTSTDQDGNYRVGELFRVSQAQGGVTLSADFFDLSGLDELRLGGISLGGSQATINEFSTENTFVASSNSIVPTQKALKSYIENRFTGGGANLFTNELTAGQIKLSGLIMSNTAGSNNESAMASVSPQFIVNGPLGGGLAALNMFMSSRTERDDFNG